MFCFDSSLTPFGIRVCDGLWSLQILGIRRYITYSCISVKKYIDSSVWFHNVCNYTMMHPKTSGVFFSVLPTSRYPHCGHILFYQRSYLFVSSYFDQKVDGDWPFQIQKFCFPTVCPSTCTKGNTPQTNQYPMNNIHFAWWSNSSFQNQDILATNKNQQVSDRHLHNMSQRLFTLRPWLILFHCPLSAIGSGENPWRAAALKLHDSSWGVRHVFGFEIYDFHDLLGYPNKSPINTGQNYQSTDCRNSTNNIFLVPISICNSKTSWLERLSTAASMPQPQQRSQPAQI